MKLDWMILANHVEVQNDLLYVAGGGWDTINVVARAPEAPAEVAAVMQGYVAIRLQIHQTETDKEHSFELTILDQDGGEAAKASGEFRMERSSDIPEGWLQNVNIVIPLSGIALPRDGLYTINLDVNNQWVGDRRFRVVTAS